MVNKDSISTKVTVALTEMAAKAENSSTSIPSDDVVAQIDDILSVADGLTLFGKSTKSYQGRDKESNGAFCTMPVKLKYQNKDTKNYAEAVLRKVCKAHVSTPYHATLRETIRQVVEETKKISPNEFVRVHVDTHSNLLKVLSRAKDQSDWCRYSPDIPIPEIAKDISLRKSPEGYKVSLPANFGKSIRLSRKDSHNNPKTDNNDSPQADNPEKPQTK